MGNAGGEIVRDVPVFGQDQRIVPGNGIFIHDVLNPLVGELGQCIFDVVYKFVFKVDFQQVGIRKITVVRSILLASHGTGNALCLIKEECFLFNVAARFQDFRLPFHFVFQRFHHESERGHVFDLGPVVECFGSFGANG